MFINKIYVIVLINGNNPIAPKLLKHNDKIVANAIKIIFDLLFSFNCCYCYNALCFTVFTDFNWYAY